MNSKDRNLMSAIARGPLFDSTTEVTKVCHSYPTYNSTSALV
jgi:hypothetical protein